MHHEKDTSQEMMAALLLSKDELGPTGRFPDGKLTSNDEGEIAFAVGVLKGKVIVNFGLHEQDAAPGVGDTDHERAGRGAHTCPQPGHTRTLCRTRDPPQRLSLLGRCGTGS